MEKKQTNRRRRGAMIRQLSFCSCLRPSSTEAAGIHTGRQLRHPDLRGTESSRLQSPYSANRQPYASPGAPVDTEVLQEGVIKLLVGRSTMRGSYAEEDHHNVAPPAPWDRASRRGVCCCCCCCCTKVWIGGRKQVSHSTLPRSNVSQPESQLTIPPGTTRLSLMDEPPQVAATATQKVRLTGLRPKSVTHSLLRAEPKTAPTAMTGV